MTGLAAFKPPTVTVHGVEFHGLSSDLIGDLLNEYPVFRAAMTGREVAIDDLIQAGPKAISKVIVGALVVTSENDAALVRGIPLEMQADMLEAIFKLTFPNGPKSFLERFQKIATPTDIAA